MTNDTDITAIPSAWADYTPLVASLLRTLLAAAGSFGCTWAYAVTASQIQMATGALMIAAAGIWGFYQKVQAKRALRRAAASPAYSTAPKLPA